ncbi:protein kinase domain-containing protein [Streptomyces sp. NBC_00158]|uniref:protein kinase domain-containing protein n=1 Tax=Streptomyces sp. NBC_00158 TaxID=2903627 RepID=UPI003255264D
MDRTLPPPGEAVELLVERLGGPLATRLLSDRRGSRAWKVTGPGGEAAVKADNPHDAAARDKTAEVAQEDDHLVRLTAAGALEPGYRIAAGAWGGGRWLAVRWADGKPLWHALAAARSPEGDQPAVRRHLLDAARTWAEQLGRMHAAGWAHADVQPTNTLVTADGHAAVIDYALACGPQDRPRLPYRGALTHTTAPEVAAALLTTPDTAHVQVEPPADVWGLGASLFWCWTGHRPVAYGDDTDRLEKLEAIAKGITTDLADVRPWLFPAFESTITACLAPDPADRPTARDLAAHLTTAGTVS